MFKIIFKQSVIKDVKKNHDVLYYGEKDRFPFSWEWQKRNENYTGVFIGFFDKDDNTCYH